MLPIASLHPSICRSDQAMTWRGMMAVQQNHSSCPQSCTVFWENPVSVDVPSSRPLPNPGDAKVPTLNKTTRMLSVTLDTFGSRLFFFWRSCILWMKTKFDGLSSNSDATCQKCVKPKLKSESENLIKKKIKRNPTETRWNVPENEALAGALCTEAMT